MFANTSDKYLDVLLPENRMYGFAISQALDAVLPDVDSSSIDNQPQSTSSDASKPQGIERAWAGNELPDIPDFYGWHLKVIIDPSKDFNQQSCRLTRFTETFRDEGEAWLCSAARVMTLRALLHFLRQPKESWGMLLGCFEFDDDECCDFMIPASELLKRS